MKQHIVSKCYLKAWCDLTTPKGYEPYIWLISRDGSNKVKRAPHKSLTRSDAYTVIFKNGKEDFRVETTLSQLERKFVDVRKKIIDRKHLNEYDRAYLAAFMATMHSRTEPVARGIKKGAQQLDTSVRKLEELHKVDARALKPYFALPGGGATITSEYTAYLVKNCLPMFVATALTEASPLMFSMSLAFLVAPRGSFFVTSDNPCVWYDPEAYKLPPLYRNPGLAFKNIEVTMPICPEIMAVVTHNPGLQGYLHLNAKKTNDLNRRTVAFADEQFVSNTEKTLPIWFDPGTSPPDSWENRMKEREALRPLSR